MNNTKKILVTGAGGQLGTSFKHVAKRHSELEFVFMGSSNLDITNSDAVIELFEKKHFDYCINCAAYTNVDKAESEEEKAFLINAKGPKNLAAASQLTKTVLIHISTDFVFNGEQSIPYTEKDKPEPIGVYGISKQRGEEEIANGLDQFFIIRTSWLYSAHGHNFMKSMIKYGGERDSLNVVFDQIGTPTYANDLALAVLDIISLNSTAFGTYHFSNEGVASWYDFAKAIFDINNITVNLQPIRTKDYPLPANRPNYSVLDKSKIKSLLSKPIPYWKDSLIKATNELKALESK